MDAEYAASVIDDAFEAFGVRGCRYVPPEGGTPVLDLVVLRHRRVGDRTRGGLMFARGGLETTDRPEALIVRSRDVQPQAGGVFVLPKASGELRFRIGEDPVDDDVWGIALRCPAVKL